MLRKWDPGRPICFKKVPRQAGPGRRNAEPGPLDPSLPHEDPRDTPAFVETLPRRTLNSVSLSSDVIDPHAGPGAVRANAPTAALVPSAFTRAFLSSVRPSMTSGSAEEPARRTFVARQPQ